MLSDINELALKKLINFTRSLKFCVSNELDDEQKTVEVAILTGAKGCFDSCAIWLLMLGDYCVLAG